LKDWEKGYWLGVIAGSIGVGLSAVILSYASPACAQVPNWDNSPYNYKNSEYNYNNSPYNYNNSPYNYNNSPYNYNSNTGVYDNSGNRKGYETISPEGVRNYFDSNGNRVGYGGK
jgi:hypothetical protein